MSSSPSARRRGLRTLLTRLGVLGAATRVRDLLWTARFARGNAPYWWRGAPDGLAIPPFPLRILVSASPDIAWFLESGRRGASSLWDTLERNGVDKARLRSVLDFGCGCGRVTRYWHPLGVATHGADFNPALVAWCQRHLAFGRFTTNALAPPLPYPDGEFDFAYALSVFTHLPEPLQRSWIAELARVVRKGGHVLFTTHGARYLGELTDEEGRHFAAGQLVVRRDDRPGANVCGAYHPEAYVRQSLLPGFALVEFIPEGAAGNPWQDLWLVRRK